MQPPPTIPKYQTVRVNDSTGLEKFIKELRAATLQSKETGGCYSAFLPLANGQKLQIEVGLPTDRRPK